MWLLLACFIFKVTHCDLRPPRPPIRIPLQTAPHQIELNRKPELLIGWSADSFRFTVQSLHCCIICHDNERRGSRIWCHSSYLFICPRVRMVFTSSLTCHWYLNLEGRLGAVIFMHSVYIVFECGGRHHGLRGRDAGGML